MTCVALSSQKRKKASPDAAGRRTCLYCGAGVNQKQLATGNRAGLNPHVLVAKCYLLPYPPICTIVRDAGTNPGSPM